MGRKLEIQKYKCVADYLIVKEGTKVDVKLYRNYALVVGTLTSLRMSYKTFFIHFMKQ